MHWFSRLVALCLGLMAACPALAQPDQEKPPARTDAGAPVAGRPEQAPIPAAALPLRARDAEGQLSAARALLADAEIDGIRARLPGLLEAVAKGDLAPSMGASIARRRVQRDALLGWETFGERLAGWQKVLTRHVDTLARNQHALRVLEQTWSASRTAYLSQQATPAGALAKADELLREISDTQTSLGQWEARLFSLRESVERAQQSLDLKIEMTRRAQLQAREQLTRAEGSPLWALLTPARLPAIAAHGEDLTRAGRAFWDRYGQRLPLDMFVLLLFLASSQLLASRTKKGALSAQSPRVLDAPILSALLIAMILARFVYPRAMSALFDLLGLASLAVLSCLTPLLVRQPRPRQLVWTLITVLALYRTLGLLKLNDPWLDLGILSVATLLLGVLAWAVKLDRQGLFGVRGGRLPMVTTLFLRAATAGLCLALLAGACGYNALLAFLLEGVALSAHWLLCTIALVDLLTAFVEASLAAGPVSSLASMRDHGVLIRTRALWLLNTLSLTLWCFAALTSFEALEPLLAWLAQLLSSGLKVGSWDISLGDLAAFFLTIYLTVMLARTVAFFLEQDILPRMQLARGVSPTVTRLSRYAILATGFILAVGAAGVDMSQVALLASALSVGIGFGLQNVINNFVSGLVLIFERPVRVGDLIQVGQLIGTVQTIGIRSSTLRTPEGAEAILPNSELIADRVINWTLSDPKRRVDIQVGVAYGTDPTRVLELLRSSAEGVVGVAHFPEPTCLFLGFGESALDFELRAWAQRSEDWVVVRSAIAVALHDKLVEAGIEIPFPQRDVHLRSIDQAAGQLLLREPEPARPETEK